MKREKRWLDTGKEKLRERVLSVARFIWMELNNKPGENNEKEVDGGNAEHTCIRVCGRQASEEEHEQRHCSFDWHHVCLCAGSSDSELLSRLSSGGVRELVVTELLISAPFYTPGTGNVHCDQLRSAHMQYGTIRKLRSLVTLPPERKRGRCGKKYITWAHTVVLPLRIR